MRNSIQLLKLFSLWVGMAIGFSSLTMAETQNLQVGSRIPEIEADSMEGLPISLVPPEGKILFILVWDVNQSESMNAMKEAMVLYKRFHEKGLDALGVSTTKTQDPVVSFCDRWMVPFPQVMNTEEDKSITDRLGITKTPSTLLIDAKGTILGIDLEQKALHEKVAENLHVDLDQLPLPPPPSPREIPDSGMRRSGMGMGGTVPGQNGGILLAGVQFQVDESLLGSLEERKSVEECKKNLRKISLALFRYRLDHENQLPEWLSDLYPTYIEDKQVFLDPNFPTPQTEWSEMADPQIPCSFTYEFSPGNRRSKISQLGEFGDKVPVVRSLYRYPRPLNLSYGGEIYFSREVRWEDDFASRKTMNDLDAKVRQQLMKIAVALDSYKKEHGDIPQELHELVSNSVRTETDIAVKSETNIAVGTETDVSVATETNISVLTESDIHIPEKGIPFNYEFSTSRENYREPTQGTTLREWRNNQRKEFGDYVPIISVRGALENGRILYLGYGGEIWEGDRDWETNLRGTSQRPITRIRVESTSQVGQGEEASALQERHWPSAPLYHGIIEIWAANQMIPLKGQWLILDRKIQQNLVDVTNTMLIFEPYIKSGQIALKAKVDRGQEGIRILFGFINPDRYLVWNIGGWNNSETAVEKRSSIEGSDYDVLNERKPFEFKYGEWHDIRLTIDADAKTARGFVDGQNIMTLQTEEMMEGRVGLGSWLTAIEVDNIQIKVQ